ncbi:MAG: hypothetical protein CO107_15470 [Deltaproteobacteria bacterium CG_4_9_14_3_um_filter_51_14]|nr:MAG: hypothetical protein CO107_15470 [Deltaproteobacteria bacterium CG_4_9_14_3_um_filter_51_14]
MNESLIGLRLAGLATGIVLLLWAFFRFRKALIARSEALLAFLFSTCLVLVSIFPASVNLAAQILALDNRQFGRIIVLLVGSNLLLWVLLFSLRGKEYRRAREMDLLLRRLTLERFLDKGGDRHIAALTVVIPALDEAENLKELLPRMPKEVNGKKIGVLVVDDGSKDNTIEVVRGLGHGVISNLFNRGGGASLRLGYDTAKTGGAELVITMDGDGQHLPEEIPALVTPILEDKTDFVIGSRVMGTREKDSLVRWMGIHFFNGIINVLAGTKITDCSNGFRAFKVSELERVLLVQDQFHTAELIIDAARKGIRIMEVPITVKRRLSGRSKKGKNLSYGVNFARSIFKSWWR